MPSADDKSALEELLAAPLGNTWWERFREGLSSPWRGLRFLNRHPGLWRYAILPTLANLLITALVLTVLVLSAAWLFAHVHAGATEGLSGWHWWLAVGAEVAVAIVFLLVCGGAAVLTWKFLTGVLCGYFYAQLAEEVEAKLGGADDQLRSISFFYEVVDTALHLALLVSVNGVFLLMNLAPVLGSVIALVGSTSFTWYLLGLDYLGFPLAMRGKRRIEQFDFGRRHLEHTLGLGAAVFVLEFVPIVGAVLLTTAVVGGVLLHRRIQVAQQSEERPATHDEPPRKSKRDKSPDEGTMAQRSDMTVRLLRSKLRRELSDDDDNA